MKTSLIKIIIIIIITMHVIFNYSCKAKKEKIAEKDKSEQTVPCVAESRSDMLFFRVANKGLSGNINISKERAILMAKQDMAKLIESHVNSVLVRYVNQHQISSVKEFSKKFERHAREVVNNILIDVEIICEKNFQEADGRYKTYVGIEVDKEVFLAALNKAINKDGMLNIDFDEERFNKIFNEKMKKIQNLR